MNTGNQMAEASSSFATWYVKNATKLNKGRRSRYRADPEYRDKALAASKKWRENNPDHNRKRKSDKPEAYTIGQAAEALDSCPQTLRGIEARKLIPPAKKGAGHRKYTPRQIELMRPLVEYLQTTHYTVPGYRKQVKALSQQLKTQWKGD